MSLSRSGFELNEIWARQQASLTEMDASIRTLERAHSAGGSPRSRELLAHAYARAGRGRDAAQLFAEPHIEAHDEAARKWESTYSDEDRKAKEGHATKIHNIAIKHGVRTGAIIPPRPEETPSDHAHRVIRYFYRGFGPQHRLTAGGTAHHANDHQNLDNIVDGLKHWHGDTHDIEGSHSQYGNTVIRVAPKKDQP